jgi:hypothetical protein
MKNLTWQEKELWVKLGSVAAGAIFFVVFAVIPNVQSVEKICQLALGAWLLGVCGPNLLFVLSLYFAKGERFRTDERDRVIKLRGQSRGYSVFVCGLVVLMMACGLFSYFRSAAHLLTAVCLIFLTALMVSLAWQIELHRSENGFWEDSYRERRRRRYAENPELVEKKLARWERVRQKRAV